MNNGRRKETKVTRFKNVAVACAVGVACLAAATGGASAKNWDKPQKPAKDVPSVSGLTVSMTPSATTSTTTGQSSLQDWLTATWNAIVANSAQKGLGYAEPLGTGAPGAIGAKTLVLYDTSNAYGWLGELYAMYAGNLASHFGSWKALPVAQYQSGLINQYTATIYIGSTYDEPLPASFLTDVQNATKPVIWIYDNIWELSNAMGASAFQAKYGWQWWYFDTTAVSHVQYKGSTLNRDGVNNQAGIMTYVPGSIDTTKTSPLAYAVHDSDGSTFPWALKSGNLIYFGENPFVYTTETDRIVAFDDILTSVLNPFAQTRHRALLRLEDISPYDDPQAVLAIAKYLNQQRIQYGFGFSPKYVDPLGYNNDGKPETITLSQNKAMADVVKYMQAHGGTLVMHGYTHQYSNVPNPYTGVTDDDFEFYRTTENADHTLNFQGPVPEDSAAWASGRILSSYREFSKAGVAAPQIFEFPHYMGSAVDYQAVGALFKTRWERSLYFGGYLTGSQVDYSHVIGQLFPWVVRDAYGTTVLPENCGDYEPEPFYQFPVHTVADVLAAAKANAVIRDNVAGFYFHTFWGLEPLKQMVSGMKALGYTFADPDTVAANG
jgi:uncharacterized protein YdaL